MQKGIIVLILACTFTQAQAARVVMDTRLAPQPTLVADDEANQVLTRFFAPQAVHGCRDVRVTDKSTGSYTKRHAQQVAYLIHNCATSYLAVFEGQTLIEKLTNIGDAIGNVGDINLDGTDELLFLSKYYGRGSNTVYDASVITLANNKFKSLLDLSETAINRCGDSEGYQVAYRVTVEPRHKPLFTLNAYKGNCVTGFQFISSRQELGK